jgi:N-acetylmuramate 1-kinase
MPKRLEDLKIWLHSQFPQNLRGPEAITNDASFRRYFRVYVNDRSYIVMDAPPVRENNAAFLDVAQRLRAAGLNVPEVLAENSAQGFYLLSDLGMDLYLPHLDEDRVERLYGDALAALAVMQVCADTRGLPSYTNELLQFEMSLYPDWLLAKHLHYAPSPAERIALQNCFDFLSLAAQAQTQVFVHRDYHARNLLVTPHHNPGIVDFQDALIGPVTYDLVSLLRDCYIVWPRARVEDWVLGYHQLAQHMGIVDEMVSDKLFLRWFDLMGLQRHIKVAGIFARLCHRDGKTAYLQDIPTALRYIIEVAQDYPEVQFLASFNQEKVLPFF